MWKEATTAKKSPSTSPSVAQHPTTRVMGARVSVTTKMGETEIKIQTAEQQDH